jgi:hypothetical protein
MDREEVWRTCPPWLRNAALAIARGYDHGWSRSTAVPSAPYFWEYDDPFPSLSEIEEGTPEGPLGKGITQPDISFEDGRYFARHRTGTGRVFIEVAVDPTNDCDLSYTVIVSRPSGEIASGTKVGNEVYVTADRAVWGTRHEDAWEKAWKALGIPAPKFPSKVLRTIEKNLVVDGKGLKVDPLRCRVTVLPTAVLSVEDLLSLRRAEKVEIVDIVGQSYDLTIS